MLGAYSSAVEYVHGMDEVGVRLPVGPLIRIRRKICADAPRHSLRFGQIRRGFLKIYGKCF